VHAEGMLNGVGRHYPLRRLPLARSGTCQLPRLRFAALRLRPSGAPHHGATHARMTISKLSSEALTGGELE
jgi:hypothetical protein